MRSVHIIGFALLAGMLATAPPVLAGSVFSKTNKVAPDHGAAALAAHQQMVQQANAAQAAAQAAAAQANANQAAPRRDSAVSVTTQP